MPETSARDTRVFSAVSMLETVFGYIAVSRCLSTMNSVFVEVDSELGRVPWFADETVRLRAGQAGSVGGGVSCTRSTKGWLLVAPL